MDNKEEYHDPDYPGTSAVVKDEPKSLSEDEKIEKIRRIIHREFTNEIEVRENEIMLIDQRMASSRRALGRLRCAIVSQYYGHQSLQLTGSQIQDEVAAQHEPRAKAEVSALLREAQRRLHPSVRKLLGNKSASLDEILYQGRVPRCKSRKDYSAMVQTRNYTIAADTTKTLRPTETTDVVVEQSGSHRLKKVPRHLQPKITSVVTLDEATRNKMKNRYRIIIGNTSKYAPAASTADRSTHKWLLYVRGPPEAASEDLSRVLRAVTVRLHHSYAPHHKVHIQKPPFHISRRGWGEFPAKVELHFALPERNRPATVEHTIKLDRNFTGLQTLGAETVVDVWLYSTPEMLPFEYKENIVMDDGLQTDVQLKQEPVDQEAVDQETVDHEMDGEQVISQEVETEQVDHQESWLDFFSKTTELDVDEMIIKPAKKPEEKPDIENMIDSNVITKDNYIGNNHVEEEKEEPPEVNERNEVNNTKVDDCILNYKTLEIQEDLPNALLTQSTSLKKRIMKYLDPTTGKIYYLEMDRNLDLSKVQEIVINSKGNVKTAKISPIKPNGLKNVRKNSKKGVSLLRPEIKSLLKKDDLTEKPNLKRNYTHIENDHCYLGAPLILENSKQEFEEPPVDDKVLVMKNESLYNSLCSVMSRFTSVRAAVNYLLKKIPVISDSARDPDFVKCFPFVVETEERFWKFDFAKRRNIEWSRAKLINKLLTSYFTQPEPIWRTKQILIYSRLHGYHPIRTDSMTKSTDTSLEWSSWTDVENTRKLETNIKEYYPNVNDINTLTKFNDEDFRNNLSESLDLTDSDEEVDIVSDVAVNVKKESAVECENLTVLPVQDEDDRLRFLFIERKCADIGIELRNEDVGNGYSYSAVHAVLLCAMRNFAEELVRGARALRLREGSQHEPVPPVWLGSSSVPTRIGAAQVSRAARAARLHALSARDLAAHAHAHAHAQPAPPL